MTEKSIMTEISATLVDLAVPRVSFRQEAEIPSLLDVSRLSRQDLAELCENFPIAASNLIVDLIDYMVKHPDGKKTEA